MIALDYLYLLLSAIIGYLLGSFNSSLVIGRFYGTDVRMHGSGNAGMTNTLRTLGKSAAAAVIIGDVLKGLLACLIGSEIAGSLALSQNEIINKNTGLLIGGLFAVIGHNWPIFFKFRGGKGALTSITVIFCMDWRFGLIITTIFILTVALTRYVSLGSLTGAVSLVILTPLLKKDTVTFVFALLIALLVIYRHKENIKRLAAGNESRLGKRTSKGE